MGFYLMSKIAFITTYFTGHWFRDKKVHAINNGFSFVDHLFENHQHFFINLSSVEESQKDVDFLKEELKKFEKQVILRVYKEKTDSVVLLPFIMKRVYNQFVEI